MLTNYKEIVTKVGREVLNLKKIKFSIDQRVNIQKYSK